MTKQLIKYGLVGVLSNFSGYLVYLFMTTLGMMPKLAMSCLYLVGASIGFIGNKKWTFPDDSGSLSAISRYGIAQVCGYLLNLSLLIIFVDKLGYPHQLVQAGAIFIVGGFLFISFKLFVFRRPQ